MDTSTPISPKVIAAGLGGAVSAILVWIISALGVDVPGEIGSAITTIVGFAIGWLMRDPLREAGQDAVTVAQAAPGTAVGDVPSVSEAVVHTEATDPVANTQDQPQGLSPDGPDTV